MIADLWVYELGDVMLLTLSRRREGHGAGEARSVHLHRGRAARRRDRHVRADRRSSVPSPPAIVATVLGPCARTCCAACPSTATCARSSAASRRSSLRVTDTGETGLRPARRRPRRLRACWRRSRAAGAATLDARDGRGAADRSGGADVSPRHGRGDDPARSGDRVARDQPDEGLLCRPGSHHSRAASRPRTRRADSWSAWRWTAALRLGGRGRRQRRRARQIGACHEQHVVAGARQRRSRLPTCTGISSRRDSACPSTACPPRCSAAVCLIGRSATAA